MARTITVAVLQSAYGEDMAANIARTPGASTVGFAAPASAKGEDQVGHLLELYTRCLHAVQGK